MAGKHRRQRDELVEPDLPITPMLDMSFQLMAFFIFTFRPAPTEGQIAMALPRDEGGQSVAAPTDITADKPVNFVVRVEAAGGAIANMSILEKDAPDPTPVAIGADVDKYQAELKARYDELKKRYEEQKKQNPALAWTPPRLTLEVDDGLLHEYVMRLLDKGVTIGFTDIAPVPADPKKR